MKEEYLSMETVEKLARLNKLECLLNDLKEYLKEEMEKLHDIAGDNFTTVGQAVYKEVLNKIEELEKKVR